MKPKNVLQAVHDPLTNELHITFGNGAIYTYSGVDAKQHQDMMKSGSLGSYLHAKIVGKHNYTKNLTHVKKPISKKTIK